MSRRPFATDRDTGVSDVEIVLEVVAAAQPGDIIEHETLRAALQHGVDHEITIDRVRNARTRSESRLLKDLARTLKAVPGLGYRVAEAHEHKALATRRKHRADRQLFRGVSLLKHVRWDEMGEEQRKAHEAQLVIMSGLYENQRSFDKRLQRAEAAIAKIMGGEAA